MYGVHILTWVQCSVCSFTLKKITKCIFWQWCSYCNNPVLCAYAPCRTMPSSSSPCLLLLRNRASFLMTCPTWSSDCGVTAAYRVALHGHESTNSTTLQHSEYEFMCVFYTVTPLKHQNTCLFFFSEIILFQQSNTFQPCVNLLKSMVFNIVLTFGKFRLPFSTLHILYYLYINQYTICSCMHHYKCKCGQVGNLTAVKSAMSHPSYLFVINIRKYFCNWNAAL